MIKYLDHQSTIASHLVQLVPNSLQLSYSIRSTSFIHLRSSNSIPQVIIMSVTSTSTASSVSATSSCHAKLYDIPTHDAACAMPMQSNNSAIMSSCCSEASVVEYDGCDYYCLAQGQSVGTLAACLIKASEAGEVWCNTNANSTATATATATGTGIVTLSTGVDVTSSATSSGSTATSTANAAAGIIASRPLSKSAMGIVSMLLAGSAACLLL
ncbi:unnamed protein product [Penicillium salamii]|uniref:Uncharacterized protein n=1 Tax=Penicillium salamii TaxID=1612424 RepID=A0A9W4JIU5_9EURO|nr:unnamed protein product [Penicillium salamii]